jgi:isopentenyl diphosphate isomerase/L-lactate dehydrogenase-like FMN-dependent dehydrogenase
MGAKACLIGRAWAFALGARGEAGVAHVLQIIKSELRVAMSLTGCTDVRAADRSLVEGGAGRMSGGGGDSLARIPGPKKPTRESAKAGS